MPTPTLSSVFTSIANAIRSKNGSAATYTPTQMPQAILDISSGSEATITITYASEFYNKTITCTKGSTTLSDTTTSSGSTVFTVDEEGTWTISCNGISISIDVVFNYESALTVTKTITVYSAASDTVSFSDLTGAKTVSTNENGVGTVSVKVLPSGTSITFTSSIADTPTNLSQKYSKTITVDKNTTEVYVMPGTPIYWYGWKREELSMKTNNWANVGTGVWSGEITYYTNYIWVSYFSKICAIGTANPGRSTGGTLHAIGDYFQGNSALTYMTKASKDINSQQLDYVSSNISERKCHKTCNYSANSYVMAYIGNSGSNQGNVYAIWIE